MGRCVEDDIEIVMPWGQVASRPVRGVWTSGKSFHRRDTENAKEGMRDDLSSIASIMVSLGEYGRSDEAAEEALKLARDMGTKSAEASIVSLQATTKRRSGRHEEALGTHRQALRMAEEANASPDARGEIMLETCHDAVMLMDEALARDYPRAAEALVGSTKKFLASVELSVARAEIETNFGDHSAFRTKYVSAGKEGKGDQIAAIPCPFLENNKCLHYEHRPKACRYFPHLHKKGMVFRLWAVVDNCHICPIVHNVYQSLKERYDFRTRRRSRRPFK